MKLKDKVKVTGGGVFNSMAGRGIISGHLLDGSNSEYYQVRHPNGQAYNYQPHQLTPIKTQTLYAYTDTTSEVHWATKTYSDKELNAFGLTRSGIYDKVIELE